MTDINPDVTDNPITVSASATGLQTGTAVRDILLIVSAIPALIAILGTRDVTKIVAYIGSAEFAPVLGVIVTGGVVAWRQWLARREHADKKTIAEAAPDSVAVIK